MNREDTGKSAAAASAPGATPPGPFRAFMEKASKVSMFEYAVRSEFPWCIHCHDRRVVTARITDDRQYEVLIETAPGQTSELAKLAVTYLYPVALAERVKNRIGCDEAVEQPELGLPGPLRGRHHIKNRTLFVEMRAANPMTVTLLNGEVLTGIVRTFSRYEILLALDEKTPLVLLRHAIRRAVSGDGRDLLKAAQDIARDWKTSPFWIQAVS